MIRSHKGGVTKPPENKIKCDDERVDTTKNPMPTKTSNLIYNLLSPLASWKCQLLPCFRGRVSHTPERVATNVACEEEAMHVPEGAGGNYVKHPEGDTASVDH